jgi:hypothetical protein
MQKLTTPKMCVSTEGIKMTPFERMPPRAGAAPKAGLTRPDLTMKRQWRRSASQDGMTDHGGLARNRERRFSP